MRGTLITVQTSVWSRVALISLGGFFEFYGDWRPIETLDIETMQKGSPSPAAFEVSHPYVFNFYFVTEERVQDLARLARLP